MLFFVKFYFNNDQIILNLQTRKKIQSFIKIIVKNTNKTIKNEKIVKKKLGNKFRYEKYFDKYLLQLVRDVTSFIFNTKLTTCKYRIKKISTVVNCYAVPYFIQSFL